MSTAKQARVGGVGLARNQPGVGEPVDQAADPGHTEVAFIGRHFVLTKVRGRFTGVQGQITVAQDPDRSTVEVTIDMASVSSGDQARDEHLRSADFFDVDQYPAATYRSTHRSAGPAGMAASGGSSPSAGSPARSR